MMATILGTCLLSFAITHLLYFCAVREEISALVSRLRPISFSSPQPHYFFELLDELPRVQNP
jgi:hypothetical protein